MTFKGPFQDKFFYNSMILEVTRIEIKGTPKVAVSLLRTVL